MEKNNLKEEQLSKESKQLEREVAEYEHNLYHLKKEIDLIDEAIKGKLAIQIKNELNNTVKSLEKYVNSKIENKRQDIKKQQRSLNKEKDDNNVRNSK